MTNRKLILRPLAIVLLSDGIPDVPEATRDEALKTIVLKPLENLSRNIVVRLLYTDAQTGDQWSRLVPRRRVKVLTQDAVVMKGWRDPSIMIPGNDFEEQDRFFDWVTGSSGLSRPIETSGLTHHSPLPNHDLINFRADPRVFSKTGPPA